MALRGVEVQLYCTGTVGGTGIAVLYRHCGEYRYSCTVQALRGVEV